MNHITKIIANLYVRNTKIFQAQAYSVLKHFYSIPIEVDDLILECLQQLIWKVDKFDLKPNNSLEKYLLSNIKFVMFSYCRKLVRKNDAILNNYVDFNLLENSYHSTYKSFQIDYSFLSKLQQEILDYLCIDKLTIKQIASKKMTSPKIIKEQIEIIRKNIEQQMDNYIE